MELKDKTVLITGKWNKKATHSLAWAVAQRGGHVVLVNKTSDATEPLTREIRSGGKKAVAIQADIQSEVELARMTHQTLAAFGHIDIVIHNLGLLRPFKTQARAAAPASLKKQLRCQQAVLPTLMRQQSGTIINVGKVRRQAVTAQSLSVLMTRIKGHCLHVQAIGPLVDYGTDGDPTFKKRLGEAMGLAEHLCVQVQHLPNALTNESKSEEIIGFLMDLISEGGGDNLLAAKEQKR